MAIIKGCIFDLDGVLVDTAVYHYQAWKRLANQLGFDFTEKENERLKGINRLDSLNLILEMAGVTVSENSLNEFAERKNSWYVEMIGSLTVFDLLPGVIIFLQELKASGYKIALGSASKNAYLILEKTQIASYFDAVVDGNAVTESKPNPTVFSKAAKLIDLSPENCLVFEDAIAGVEAAKNAGMRVIGIGSSDNLNKADLVISGIDKMNIEKLKQL